MNRREFLKLGGLASIFVYASISPIGVLAKLPVATVTLGKTYRGTQDGNIYLSENGGKSWQLHTSFGPDCPILEVSTNLDGQLRAHIGYKRHSFHLVLSKDGKTWRL